MKIIITEDQQELVSSKLHDMIKKYGIKTASKSVGGTKNLLKILNINSPMDFLHLFDDLDVVQSEEEPNWDLFMYKPKFNIMIYNKKHDEVYINYDEIWSVLEDNFGLNHREAKKLTQEWLSDVYDLSLVRTIFNTENSWV